MRGIHSYCKPIILGVLGVAFWAQASWAQVEDIVSSSSQPPASAQTQSASSAPASTSSSATPSQQGGSSTSALVVGNASGPVPYLSQSSVQVDPSSGSASTSIPISVLPGRGGIQPTISLNYNSNLRNGLAGMGWNFDLGAIQRNTKKGPPKYDATDTFVLVQSGSSQELIFDPSPSVNYYRAKDEGAFMKIEMIGSGANAYWLATDKKGTKYTFGNATLTTEYDPANSAHIFKWLLSRVEDVHGNYMTISYWGDPYKVYPDKIEYTKNINQTSLPYHASVRFFYEGRTDVINSNMAGFDSRVDQRLKYIRIYAGATLQSEYLLDYGYNSNSSKSNLTSVVQRDPSQNALPVTIFSYSDRPIGVSSAQNFNTNPPVGLGDGRIRFMDMNKDGLPDMLDANASVYRIYFNQGNNQFGPPIPAAWDPSLGGSDPNLRFIDFNADGLLDVIKGSGAGCPGSPWLLWINNGINGYQSPINITQCPNHALNDNNWTQFVDFNGDGYTDIVDARAGNYQLFINNGSNNFAQIASASNSPSSGTDNLNVRFLDVNADNFIDVIYGDGTAPYQIWVNNRNNGFQSPQAMSYTINHSINQNNRINFVDMNNDGLVDMVDYEPFGSPVYRLYLNNGKNDFIQSLTTNVSPNLGPFFNGRWIDMNGDGLLDLVYTEGANTFMVAINNGKNDFLPPYSLNVNQGNINDAEYTIVDLNADGVMDIVRGDVNNFRSYINQSTENGGRPDALLSVNNSLGAVTTLEYDNKPVAGLSGYQYSVGTSSYLLNVVKKSTVAVTNAVASDSYQTNYQYEDALWDHGDQEFRGFKRVKTIDPEGNYSLVQFYQDDIKKGRVEFQETHGIVSGVDTLFAKSINQWNSQIIYQNGNDISRFVFLEQTDNFTYDGAGKRTQQKFYYTDSPQYGNLTKTEQLGEVNFTTGLDIPGDTRTIESEYLNNTSAGKYLIGFPKHTAVKNNAGTIVRQNWFFYDNNTDFNQAPVKGLLTKKEDWNGNAQGHIDNPKTQYSYTPEGNLQTTTDPKNAVTTVVYDPGTKIFPISTTNALNHTVNTEYYGVNGVPLNNGAGLQGTFGQVKTTTDPNNQTVTKTYDTFGRPVAAISPMDSITFPTSMTEYQINSDYVRVKTRARVEHGQAATIDSVQFYDGLGRAIQSKTISETSGQYIVSGQTRYNSRGLPEKQYLARFTSNDFNTLDNILGSQLYTLTEYDAVGRAVKTTSPDTSFAVVQYGDWQTTTIDENGHKQKSYFDAYGRLIKKEEFSGATGQSPHYPISDFAVYATTNYEYDSEGNLKKVIDNANHQTNITYDDLGRKKTMNDPDMGNWQYFYDKNGNLDYQIDAKGQTLDFDYDVLNRLKEKRDAAQVDVDYTYDDAAVSYSKGRLTRAQYVSTQNTQFIYDQLGRETKSTKVIDNTNYVVERAYDALSRLKNVKYPDAGEVSYTYNSAGQIETAQSVITNAGVPIAFDSATTNQANGQSALSLSHTVGASGTNRILLVGVHFEHSAGSTIPRANQVTYNGVAMTLIDRDNVVNGTLVDVAEMWYLINPPTGTHTVNAQFNISANAVGLAAVSLTGVSQQAPQASAKAHGVGTSASVNIATVTPGAWVFDHFTEEGSGTIITPGAGQVVRYNVPYTGNFRFAGSSKEQSVPGPTSMSWTIGSSRAWALIAAALAPATPSTSTTFNFITNVNYNEHGQIREIYLGSGERIVYEYFPNNLRLKRLTTDHGPSTALIQDLNYTYDSSGNILTIVDPINTSDQTFTYDELSRLKTATGYYCGTSSAPTICTKTYQYDQLGNIVQKDNLIYYYNMTGNAGPHAVTGLSDGTTFDYDTNGNMIRETKGSTVKEYVYDTENRLMQVILNGGIIEEYTYDGDGGRTKRMTYRGKQMISTPCFLKGTPVLMADGTTKPIDEIKVGDMVNAFEENGGRIAKNKVLNIFHGKKIKEYLLINGKLKVTSEHLFYLDGQWVEAKTLKISDRLLTPERRQIEVKEIQKISVPESVEVYDIEVEKNHNYFVSIDELSSHQFVLVHNQMSFTVQPAGMAMQFRPTITTKFVGSLYEEDNNRKTRFIYLGDMKIASVTTDNAGVSKVNYYLHDHLGGTNMLTDDTGVVKELTEYEPFGQMTRHEKFGSSEDVAWYYFTGKPLDEMTGLYYFGARYYDPKLGRFLTADSEIPYFADGQSYNRYAYVRNNPVNLVDEDGHLFFLVAAIIGAAIGAATSAITGGNVLHGLITGAIAGAVFNIVGGFGGEGVMKILAHTLGGGASGALGALATGQDPGLGALTGAFSAGITEWVGQNASFLQPSGGKEFGDLAFDVAKRGAVGAITGGITSVAFGGNFMDGFALGGMTGAAAFVANHNLHDVENWLKQYLNADGIEYQLEHIKNTDSIGEKIRRGLWVAVLSVDGASNLVPGEGTIKMGVSKGAKYLYKNVYKSTFSSKASSLFYHLNKHGSGRTALEYVKDAQKFFEKYKTYGKPTTLKDGTSGIKIRIDGVGGGYFTPNGQVVSFWDK